MFLSLTKLIKLSISFSRPYRTLRFFWRKLTTRHRNVSHAPSIYGIGGDVAIVGSGASLKKLRENYDASTTVIALNGSFRNLRDIGITPDYLVIEDVRAYHFFSYEAKSMG